MRRGDHAVHRSKVFDTEVIRSQKVFIAGIRSCGALPAISAELIAPMEIPATQSSGVSAAFSISATPH